MQIDDMGEGAVEGSEPPVQLEGTPTALSTLKFLTAQKTNPGSKWPP